ncbi:MAG: NifU family protein [Thermoplasmata archaeon]|nr:NifU family protein [Thermoplasmata archaeon]
MRDKVEKVLEKHIRPALRADGGDIELVDVDEAAGEVKVRLQGACAGCPMSQLTSLTVVERILKQEIPELKKVMTVT